jgi:hypothetical protein
MIRKFQISQLRNAEHLQFVTDSDKTFRTYLLEVDSLSPLYDNFSRLVKTEEASMAIEVKNGKIKLKNEAEQIIDALNVFIQIRNEPSGQALAADLNTLVDKYDTLIAQRKGRKKENAKTTD